MKFFTFEGINGCGKTTQLEYLIRYFTELGGNMAAAKEPSSLGGRIRDLIIEQNQLDPLAKLLIFQADRIENIAKNIRPALQSDKIVLCDRFIDSTVAYQVYGNRILPEIIATLNQISTGNLLPDCTFWIDTSVSKCMRRNSSRRDKSTRHNYPKEYLARVREGYQEIAAKNPQRIIRIDGNRERAVVSAEIIEQIKLRLDKKQILSQRQTDSWGDPRR